jgi:hypothetical protein
VTVSLGAGADEGEDGEPVTKTVLVEATVELQLLSGYGATAVVEVTDGTGTVGTAVPMAPEP